MSKGPTLALAALATFAGATLGCGAARSVGGPSGVAPRHRGGLTSATQDGPAPSPVLPGAIIVQVTDTSLNPLRADVSLPALAVNARLSADGMVTLADVPDGVHLVEVGHEGHAFESRRVRVMGDTVRVAFALPPAAAGPIGAEPTRAQAIARARLRYFIERSATVPPAVFIARRDIERRHARAVSALLRDVPNVTVERTARRRTIVRSGQASGPGCAAGMLLFVDGAELPPPDTSDAEDPRRSHAGWRLAAAGAAERGLRTVRWVGPSGGDLVRVAHDPAIGSGPSAVRGPLTTDIDRVDVRSVVAVEVYSSRRSVPPEFQMDGAECGVLLIWTTGA